MAGTPRARPQPGETVLEDLDAATVSRQGVTTIFIGQDGESNYPLRDYYGKALLEHELPAGAFGLSTGLEYEWRTSSSRR